MSWVHRWLSVLSIGGPLGPAGYCTDNLKVSAGGGDSPHETSGLELRMKGYMSISREMVTVKEPGHS